MSADVQEPLSAAQTHALMLRDASEYIDGCREQLVTLLACLQGDDDPAGTLEALAKLAGSLEAAGHCIEMVQGDPK